MQGYLNGTNSTYLTSVSATTTWAGNNNITEQFNLYTDFNTTYAWYATATTSYQCGSVFNYTLAADQVSSDQMIFSYMTHRLAVGPSQHFECVRADLCAAGAEWFRRRCVSVIGHMLLMGCWIYCTSLSLMRCCVKHFLLKSRQRCD